VRNGIWQGRTRLDGRLLSGFGALYGLTVWSRRSAFFKFNQLTVPLAPSCTFGSFVFHGPTRIDRAPGSDALILTDRRPRSCLPEQHGLSVTLTIRLFGCQHHIEGCPTPTPLIDNLKRTALQRRHHAICRRRPDVRQRHEHQRSKINNGQGQGRPQTSLRRRRNRHHAWCDECDYWFDSARAS